MNITCIHSIMSVFMNGNQERRLPFGQWLLNRSNMDENFVRKILCPHSRMKDSEWLVNMHNHYSKADKYLHAVLERHCQFEIKGNIWMGVLGTHTEIAYNLNGATYFWLWNEKWHSLLEELPLLHRMDMFMHDGAPPHFSLQARDWLDANLQ